jgi:hypothetical protein
MRRRLATTLGVMLATLAVLTGGQAHAVNPPPVQLFYVPFPEDQLLQGLRGINAANPTNPVTTYIALSVVANGTIVYYDQWENGYDADIANPANLHSSPGNTGGTQIWGDGNPANGAPPGLPGDILDAGTVVILNNTFNTTNMLAIDYDGRDKIAATKTIAVTKTGWASVSDTLLAGSVEVFDTNNWGTDYRFPSASTFPTRRTRRRSSTRACTSSAARVGRTSRSTRTPTGSTRPSRRSPRARGCSSTAASRSVDG